jgi:rod shape-determining protein MreD
MSRSVYVALGLLAVLAIGQATVFSRFPLFGIVPQFALVAAICWALLRGPYEGLIWAFIASFFLDLFSIGPLGSTALPLMVAVLAVTQVRQIIPENPYALPPLLAGLAMAIYMVLYTLLLQVTRPGVGWQWLQQLPGTVLLHAILTLPVYWLLHAVARFLYPPQIEM